MALLVLNTRKLPAGFPTTPSVTEKIDADVVLATFQANDIFIKAFAHGYDIDPPNGTGIEALLDHIILLVPD